jgi:HEPN domain-containing protein
MPILVGKAIKGLLQRASADLAKLQRNIQQHDLYLTYFLTQQVIEKCFKILISLKNSNFPKKHDLSELYEIVIQLYAQEPSTLNVISSYASSYSRLTEVYEDERYGM